LISLSNHSLMPLGAQSSASLKIARKRLFRTRTVARSHQISDPAAPQFGHRWSLKKRLTPVFLFRRKHHANLAIHACRIDITHTPGAIIVWGDEQTLAPMNPARNEGSVGFRFAQTRGQRFAQTRGQVWHRCAATRASSPQRTGPMTDDNTLRGNT
jgi:hypothetical protein